MLALALTYALSIADEPVRRPSLTGDIRHHRFASEALGNERDIWVYLPPGYEDEPGRQYPVVIFGDGQNVFDGATSFLPNLEWRADETAQSLIRAGMIDPIVMIAVANTPSRADEYLPTRARVQDQAAGGRADAYGEMLTQELLPWVAERYRIRTTADATALVGSSFGGVKALYVGLRHPDRFGLLGVMSPSVWWDDRYLLRFVDRLEVRPPTRVWIDMGTAEGAVAVLDARRLRDAMIAKGWREGTDLQYYEDSGAVHNESAWAGRLDLVLLWFFGRKR